MPTPEQEEERKLYREMLRDDETLDDLQREDMMQHEFAIPYMEKTNHPSNESFEPTKTDEPTVVVDGVPVPDELVDAAVEALQPVLDPPKPDKPPTVVEAIKHTMGEGHWMTAQEIADETNGKTGKTSKVVSIMSYVRKLRADDELTIDKRAFRRVGEDKDVTEYRLVPKHEVEARERKAAEANGAHGIEPHNNS